MGITREDAVKYRDFIIDWLTRAVHEGRLSEEPRRGVRDNSRLDPLQEAPDDLLGTEEEHDGARMGSAFSNYFLQTPIPEDRPSNSDAMPRTQVTGSTGTTQRAPWSETRIRNRATNLRQGTPPKSAPEAPGYSPSSPQPSSQSKAQVQTTLASRARTIQVAWTNRDFDQAKNLLTHQLAAVERGETTTYNGQVAQPDRRLLRHLVGVCASYCGDISKAKEYFQTVLNGSFLVNTNGTSGTRAHLDEGDIAAARWLGDVCILLREPCNAALAWSIAYRGLIDQRGSIRAPEHYVRQELLRLEAWLGGISELKRLFQKNIDPSDIFKGVSITKKQAIISGISCTGGGRTSKSYPPRTVVRPKTDWGVQEPMLVAPLLDSGLWPLQWDATFLPEHALIIAYLMTGSEYDVKGLVNRSVPPTWEWKCASGSVPPIWEWKWVPPNSEAFRMVMEDLQCDLKEKGLDHRVVGSKILCVSKERAHGFSHTECIYIGTRARDLPLQRHYSVLRVPERAIWVTRRVPPEWKNNFSKKTVANDDVLPWRIKRMIKLSVNPL